MRLASNFAIERHVCAGLSGRPDELVGALEDGTGRKTTGDGEKKERVSLYVSRVVISESTIRMRANFIALHSFLFGNERQ